MRKKIIAKEGCLTGKHKGRLVAILTASTRTFL